MGEHIQSNRGEKYIYVFHLTPTLQGHHGISKVLFWTHTFTESKIFALQIINNNFKWRPHEKFKDNTSALVFEKKGLAWLRAAGPRSDKDSLTGSGYGSSICLLRVWALKLSTLLPVRCLPSIRSGVLGQRNVGVHQENQRTQCGPQEARNQAPSLTLIKQNKISLHKNWLLVVLLRCECRKREPMGS